MKANKCMFSKVNKKVYSPKYNFSRIHNSNTKSDHDVPNILYGVLQSLDTVIDCQEIQQALIKYNLVVLLKPVKSIIFSCFIASKDTTDKRQSVEVQNPVILHNPV